METLKRIGFRHIIEGFKPCKNGEKVITFFKNETSKEMQESGKKFVGDF